MQILVNGGTGTICKYILQVVAIKGGIAIAADFNLDALEFLSFDGPLLIEPVYLGIIKEDSITVLI